MKAVILAGGKGTRLGPLARDIPKSMVPVGGTPVLFHQLALLRANGVMEVVLCVNHLAHVIKDAVGDGASLGMRITYVDDGVPAGTAGAVLRAAAYLNETFLVLYGDIMVAMDLRKLVAFHRSKKGVGTLVVHPTSHPHDSDLVDVDDASNIIAFSRPPHQGRWHNLGSAALYVLEPAALRHIREGFAEDFGRDVFPRMLAGEAALSAYNTPEYLRDTGTPERFARVEEDHLAGRIAASRLPRRCVFLDRDGTLIEAVPFLNDPSQVRLLPDAADALKLLHEHGFLCVVVTNQPVIARGECTPAQLVEIHKELEMQLGMRGAFVDAIHHCPHHPDAGHPGEVPSLKVACACRKPAPGMLLQAARGLNIDLATSFMVGDSWRDIEAGTAAGCTSIGVKTGEGCKDCAQVPQLVDSLLDAARRIIATSRSDEAASQRATRL